MQKTLCQSIDISGIGLHTGFQSNLELVPAPANTGIIFRRSDLDHFPIPAIKRYVSKVSYATSLMKQGVLIATVEHVLSAIHALEIDNLYVDVDTMEIPIVDGSALPFVEMIDQAGVCEQDCPRRFIQLSRPLRVESENKWIEAEPYDGLLVHYSIFFPHPLIQHQEFVFQLDPLAYRKDVCGARTFGFYEELDSLKKAGLIRGGSLENAIVLDKTGILNPELRFADEFVRHKVLDLLGDIALVGNPIRARIRAHCAGHAMHFSLANQILKHREGYDMIEEDHVRQPLVQEVVGSRLQA